MSISLAAATPLVETGGDLVPWIAGGAVVLVLVGGGLLLLLRRGTKNED